LSGSSRGYFPGIDEPDDAFKIVRRTSSDKRPQLFRYPEGRALKAERWTISVNIVMSKVLREMRRTTYFISAKDGFQEEFEGRGL
jgi:hypothetical protein